MLLASYLPSSNDYVFKSDNYRRLSSVLGYNPIICINAEEISDLIIQSTLGCFECPETFYLFDVDDYEEINLAVYTMYDKENIKDEDIFSHVRKSCRGYIIKEIPKNSVSIDILNIKYSGIDDELDNFNRELFHTYKTIKKMGYALYRNSEDENREKTAKIAKLAFERSFIVAFYLMNICGEEAIRVSFIDGNLFSLQDSIDAVNRLKGNINISSYITDRDTITKMIEKSMKDSGSVLLR